MIRGRFEYKLLSKYPHMKPADIEIWEKFIINHPDIFKRVDYDFHVGEGAKFLPTNDNTPGGMQNRIYQRKIDVVAYDKDGVTLIEIKPLADTATLGQILAYKDFYFTTKGSLKNPKLLVICGKIMSEMKDIFSKQNITIMVV